MSAGAERAVLRLRGVCFDYGASAEQTPTKVADAADGAAVVDGFDLDLIAGERVALWGPSGSGKTTLLNLAAALLRPHRGTIELFPDSDAALAVHRLDAAAASRYRREHLGYVFQFFNLIPTLTAAENLRLMLELAGCENRWPQCAARMQALGLEALADRFPDSLSGGEQQRLAVLRALAHEPALLLADEPTGNLDRENSRRVADMLWEQTAASGTALLIATHSDAIAQRADRVVEFR